MRKKIHNFVLKTLVTIAAIGFAVSGCMLDEQSSIPVIVCAACLAFIGLFVFANKERWAKWI